MCLARIRFCFHTAVDGSFTKAFELLVKHAIGIVSLWTFIPTYTFLFTLVSADYVLWEGEDSPSLQTRNASFATPSPGN